MRRWLVAALLLVAACTSPPDGGEAQGDLPPIDGAGIRALLADLDRPAVVNVWGSWCVPCRSEAPLLAALHREMGDEVVLIGVDVQDDRSSALEFIEEFGLDFDHYFDATREVPAELGGFGTPITYFVAPGGEIVETHSGIIDEQRLALMVDELTAS